MWSRLLLLALLLLPAPALADVKEKVAALAPAALVLVMDANGNELVAQNADKPFVPASVAKIVTAWLAMEVLGRDYRFQTRFYLDAKRVLYVRGGGDPMLISEELALLAPRWSTRSASSRSPAWCSTRATSRPTSASRDRGQQRVLRRPELGAGGELQHDLRRAQRQGGSAPPRRRLRSPRWRSASSGREVQRVAAASAWPKTLR